MKPFIELDSLVKQFGARTVVSALDFSVGKGEVLGFLGPNGAGKTTTMRMLAGYLRPSAGTARINGIDILEFPLEAKSQLGYLPEGAPLYGDMSVAGFLEFIAAARNLTGATRRLRLDDVFAKLGLESVAAQKIDTLSKGFRRRVGIAQAILHDPPVLILDEPTDGLDPNQKRDMRALITAMAPEKAIIISTHLLDEVDAICTRAIIIDHGVVKADNRPDELRARSTYYNAIVVTLRASAANILEKRLKSITGIDSLTRTSLPKEKIEFLIKAGDHKLILDRIEDILKQESLTAESIAVERGRLEEVFQALTSSAPAEAAA
jgi:ABC-2 type transport system ATP-binding protein